ncbi:MAG: outer membrane beta-barrel protein [Bauldia sp.]|nr:outer membrane beta-barrel protein [Bauldia sp.]
MKTVRQFVFATCAAVAAAGFSTPAARAADMPVYEVPVVEPSGFYAGIFAGGGWGDSVISNIDPEVEGFMFGGLAGWELRRGGVVAGVEADIAFTGIDGVNAPASTSADINWLASVRGRLGFDAGSMVTIYGTGGLAFAHMDASVATLTPSSDSSTLTGYTVGAGIEARLMENLSGRIEYLYYDFNQSDFVIGTASQADLRLHTVRGALVYNFTL